MNILLLIFGLLLSYLFIEFTYRHLFIKMYKIKIPSDNDIFIDDSNVCYKYFKKYI